MCGWEEIKKKKEKSKHLYVQRCSHTPIIKTGQVDTGSPVKLLHNDPDSLRFQSHPLSSTSCGRRRLRCDGRPYIRDKQDCESMNVSHQCVAHEQRLQVPRCFVANAGCNVVRASLWRKSSWNLSWVLSWALVSCHPQSRCSCAHEIIHWLALTSLIASSCSSCVAESGTWRSSGGGGAQRAADVPVEVVMRTQLLFCSRSFSYLFFSVFKSLLLSPDVPEWTEMLSHWVPFILLYTDSCGHEQMIHTLYF